MTSKMRDNHAKHAVLARLCITNVVQLQTVSITSSTSVNHNPYCQTTWAHSQELFSVTDTWLAIICPKNMPKIAF